MSTKKEIEKIFDSLDLGFSDCFNGENVRQLTLQKKLDIMQQSVELVTFEEAMNFSVFSSEGSDHPTAEIYAIDFPSDLRASIYLLLGGYYRQAILCLRSWLEIRLTGIYFGLVNQDRTYYEDWKNGRQRAPIGQGLIKKLFSRAEFQKLDKKLGFRDQLKNVYTELSAFTHGGILTRYNLQSETDNVPRFNSKSVELWFEFALRVFRELVICYFGAYGRKAFLINADELKTLRRYLSPSYLQELQNAGILLHV
jgi:hypothetical protein